MSAPPTKDASIFIIDGSPSMLEPYQSKGANTSLISQVRSEDSSTPVSRLSSAIQAVKVLISSQMLRSKTHEVAVILIGTSYTDNRLATANFSAQGDYGGYGGMVELNSDLERPTSKILQDLEKIKEKQGFDPQDFGFKIDKSSLTGLLDMEIKGEGKGALSDDDHDDDDEDDFDPYREQHLSMMKKIVSKTHQQQKEKQKQMEHQQMDLPQSKSLSVPSDLIRGLILAGDILHKKTATKRFNRKIYLLTDAESELEMDETEHHFDLVMTGFERMEVETTVIGLDFKTEADFDEDGNDKRKKKKPKTKAERLLEIGGEGGGSSDDDSDGSNSDGSDDDDDNDDDDDDMSDDETPEEKRQRVKEENEKVIISIAQKTRGKVIAARNLIEMMKVAGAKRIPKSTKKKFALSIAPGLTVEAEYSLLISKANLQTLKVHAINMNELGNIMKDADYIPIYSDIVKESSYRDPKNPDIEVELKYRAKAYRYGSDYITTNAYDELSLKTTSPVQMHIMGYASRDTIPISFLIDSGYTVTGGTSNRGQVAISAIAQGLHEEKKVAISKFVKSTDADPIVGVLLPMEAEPGGKSHVLVFIQMPFAEDLSKSHFRKFDKCDVEEKGEKIVDNLIDSMMLGGDELVSTTIPNPAIRSLNRTLIRRIVKGPNKEDDASDIVDCVGNGDIQIDTPEQVLEGAKGAIAEFTTFFGIEESNSGSGDKATEKKRRYWSEALDLDDDDDQELL